MRAIKSCLNEECKSYIHKTKYNDAYIYCPMCGEKLAYVCADCWTRLPHSTEKLCPECKEKRKLRREQQQEKILDGGAKIAKTVGTVVAAVATVANNGNKIAKAIKKK